VNSRQKGRATWLPDILRDAGLPVEVLPEFAGNGKEPKGWVAMVDHHDASPISSGVNGGLNSIRYGRPDLPKPLANLFLKRNGVHVCVADGAANHPGVSYLPLEGGISSGVKYRALGREVALNGIGEPYPTNGRQYEAMQQGNAAICIYLGLDPATQLWDHKSIARPVGRKIDIRPYDLPDGRVRCARYMTGQHPAPAPIPVILQEDDMALAYRFPDGNVWLCTGTHRTHVSEKVLKERAVLRLVAEVPATDPSRDPQYPQWVRKTDARGAAILGQLKVA